MLSPIVPDARWLASFIDTTLTGWLLLVPIAAALVAVVVIGASTLGRDIYRAHPVAKHHPAPGRTHTPIPDGAEPRPARHALGDEPTEQIPVVDLVEAVAA